MARNHIQWKIDSEIKSITSIWKEKQRTKRFASEEEEDEEERRKRDEKKGTKMKPSRPGRSDWWEGHLTAWKQDWLPPRSPPATCRASNPTCYHLLHLYANKTYLFCLHPYLSTTLFQSVCLLNLPSIPPSLPAYPTAFFSLPTLSSLPLSLFLPASLVRLPYCGLSGSVPDKVTAGWWYSRGSFSD